jgi:hypothetical protein
LIEPRIYRAAFLPALLAAFIAMFSLETQPRALPPASPADVLFEGTTAANTVRSIVSRAPDRRAGTQGDARTAERLVNAFKRLGFTTTIDRFEDDGAELTNVVGTRPGLSRRRVVLVAARDALSVPDATGSGADTAALLEVARVLEGRAARKTIVLASVDGAGRGHAGARRLGRVLRDSTGRIDAVIVVSNLGAPKNRRTLLVDWSNDSARGGLGLRRTAANALRNEVGEDGGGPGSPPAQLARLAFPVGIGAQSVLLGDGFPAIRISGSGELAPAIGERALEDLDPERYEEFGRSVLRLLFTLDEQPPPAGREPEAYITVTGRVAPEWAVSLLAITLILPVLVASIDAFARARRRREAVLPWLAWLAGGIVPFGVGLALAELLVLTGLAENAPPAPLDPSQAELDTAAIASVAAVALTIALAWMLIRSRVLRRASAPPDPAAAGAGVAVALVLSGFAIVTWVVNPFTALALVLPLHLWALAVLTGARARTRAWLVAAGLLPAALIVATYAIHLRMGPLEGGWYLFLLVTGHHVGLGSALLGCVALGVLASVIAIVIARARSGEEPPPRTPGRRGRVDDRPVSGPLGPPLERVRR